MTWSAHCRRACRPCARGREHGRGSHEAAEHYKPFWSGVVSFGLVSVPVSLFPAIRSTTLRLRMVDADGNFLERRFFDAD
jgi:hypothetical protein